MDASANTLEPVLSLRASSQGPDAASSSHPTDTGGPNEPSMDSQLHPDQSVLASEHRTHLRPLVTTLGWDLNKIITSSPNFHHVRRVHCTSPAAKAEVVIPEFEENGTPLIISGWNRHPRWPKSIFTLDWLWKNGDQNPTVRNVHDWADVKMPIGDFIDKLRRSPVYASADERERFYGKDGECPAEWTEWLTRSGAIPEQLLFNGSNDFLKFLPDSAKVQTLMCYMGIGDTFTPFHKDLCASSGQNLMCYTEHSGSAFWFMTKSSAAPQVAIYFHQLGQEVDLETHVVTIEELAKAPFDVYIAEQQLGDLVLVPPRSCHQVVNKGGVTIKTSWSRMSLSGLHLALWHELPIYHRVCRQEIYKVKSNIFHALQHFTTIVENLPEPPENTMYGADGVALQQLIDLFDDILASEFSGSWDSMPHVSQPGSPHMDTLHCDFCGADIFQSFFECVPCRTASSENPSDNLPIGDGLVLCPSCYVEGRTCRCGVMEPVQCRPYSDLLQVRDQALRAIQRYNVGYNNAYGYLSERPGQLLSGRQVNIFEAACNLSQQRQSESKGFRSCRAHREQVHQVPAAAAIYCKPCHGSKCYAHLLEGDCVHSVDAIVLSDHYDGDADWHLFHRRGAKQYQESWRSVIEDEEKGSRPDASLRLTYLAKTFTTCRAIAPEETEHGWYDRYALTTFLPIADTPAKVLFRLPDELETDELCDNHPEQHESPSPQRSRSPITNSLAPAPASSGSLIDDPAIADRPTRPVADLETDHPAFLASESNVQEFLAVASAPIDDPGDLSDLTDLEVDSSPPRIGTITGAEASNLRMTVDSPLLPISTSRAPDASITGLRSVERSKPGSKVKFDGVEIPRPEWRSATQAHSISKLKRKRTRSADSLTEDDTHTEPEQLPRRYPVRQLAVGRHSQTSGPSSSSIPGPSTPSIFASPSPAKHVALSQSSIKGKRKMSSRGASRPPRPNERACTQSAPQANILASALNQTFMHNSSAGHPSTIPPPNELLPPVNNTNNLPRPQPQYVDVMVQTKLRFTRRTSTDPPPVDPFINITRLQKEKDELQTELDKCKQQRDFYSECLEEFKRSYVAVNSQSYAPSGGGSVSHTSIEFSTHAGSRVQRLVTDDQSQSMDVQEPDYPPIETLPLPTPSSGESPGRLPESNPLSFPSPTRRQTPTEPRSHRRAQDVHASYHFGPRRLGKQGSSGETSRTERKRKDKYRKDPPSFGNARRFLESPIQPIGTAEAGPSNLQSVPLVAGKGGDAHSNLPPSPPSTVSDQTPVT